MKKNKYDYFEIIGLNDLDEENKKVIEKMEEIISSFNRMYPGWSEKKRMGALYSQNILLLKQLSQINKKNDKIVEQNEILQQQNNQIIELLQKIANK